MNLPAHLVVIKGTSQYSSTGTSNLEAAQILQMIGRAGRPQFDQYGTAVVLTTANQKLTYEVSLNGAKSIESRYCGTVFYTMLFIQNTDMSVGLIYM